MDVGCPIFVGFPDDLVDKLNDGGFLIKIAEILFQRSASSSKSSWLFSIIWSRVSAPTPNLRAASVISSRGLKSSRTRRAVAS